MEYKADWPEAMERWTALWEGRRLDRPCMTVVAPNGMSAEWPRARTGEEYWLDADFNIRLLRERFRTTYYGGEAYPSHLLMAAWVLNTYGATPHFPFETIWYEPRPANWDEPPAFVFDWESPWFKRVAALYEAVLDEADHDRFLAGRMGSYMPVDMLSFVIGPEQVLLGMAEHPEWMDAALRQLADNWVESYRYFERQAQPRHAYWYGNAGWMPFWAPEPFKSSQCDLSCMISPEMFERFVIPELDRAGQEFQHVWYHLDGQSAFQHLDRLLSLPYLKVMQFVPMAGTPCNGPEYLDFYRKVQAAGKIVHIAVAREHVKPLCENLDSTLLCLDVSCSSQAEADELLKNAQRWTRRG